MAKLQTDVIRVGFHFFIIITIILAVGNSFSIIYWNLFVHMSCQL